MADVRFTDNLARWVAAEAHLHNVQLAAKDLFGKGYFSLSEPERRAVENAVWPQVQTLARWATPQEVAQWLGDEANQERPAFGFAPNKTNSEKPSA